MFIFHEGLPGSGKSYECVVYQIIPALKIGRKVYARINGLEHKQIAELIGKDLEYVKEHLIQIDEEQVMRINEHVANDSLVIIDELQNYWPNGRAGLTPEMTKFVTEHRHLGIDIVGMGQSIADIHVIWRRRCEQKLQFLKMSMLGKPKKYKWTMFQGVLNAKGEIGFLKVKSGTKDYDEKYFGSYKSHVDSTTNKDTKEDDRVNVLKTGGIMFGIPSALVLGGFAIWYLSSFFTGGTSVVNEDAIENIEVKTEVQTAASPRTQATANSKTPNMPVLPIPTGPKLKSGDPAVFILDNNSSYTAKIVYKEEKHGAIFDALVVWLDSNNRLVDQLYLDDFRELGFRIKNKGYGFQAIKNDVTLLFRFRPDFDVIYSISKDTRTQLNTGV